MSSMPSVIDSKLITGEELLQMTDVGPCELIEGRILPMSPTAGGEHGLIESRLTIYLGAFVNSQKLGWILNGEVGIYTRRNPDSVRGTDVIFISKKRLPKRPERGFLEIAPELVVEIMSPTETWKEIEQKLDEYLAIGVKWIWVIDPEEHTCTVYRSKTDLQKLTENNSLIGEDILDGLEIKISTLFKE